MNAPLQDRKVLQAGDPDLWLKAPDLSISVGELADSVRAGDLYQDSELRVSACLLYTSPSPRDGLLSRMPSSA